MVFCPGSPPITSNCSDMVFFSANVHLPKTAFTFMCLTILHGCHGNADCSLRFFQADGGSQIMQPGICPCWSSSPNFSSQLTYWIISDRYREAVCVTPVADLQALKVGFGYAQSGDLAQVIWPCFAWLAHNQASISRGWEFNSNE